MNRRLKGQRVKRSRGQKIKNLLVLLPFSLLTLYPIRYMLYAESPLFFAELPNPNDFSLFANGGWDGNWYVGFNTCWMQKIPVEAKGKIEKAFIGAKLGRMKNFQAPGKAPWERKAVPGKIYMAISSTASWSRKQSFFLTTTEDIPLEPDFEVAYENVGESRWFWTEVPVRMVNLAGDNYLALWSPTEGLTSASSSPILAAGWGTKEVNSWVSHEIKGMPPTDPSKALSTPITVFEPAIAIKLIPSPAYSPERRISDSQAGGGMIPESQAPRAPPRVKISRIADGKPRGKEPAPKIVCGTVEGESMERSWIEISTDSKKWSRYGRYVWNAPACFTLRIEELPIGSDGKIWVRLSATNQWEIPGVSEPVNLFEPQGRRE